MAPRIGTSILEATEATATVVDVTNELDIELESMDGVEVELTATPVVDVELPEELEAI